MPPWYYALILCTFSCSCVVECCSILYEIYYYLCTILLTVLEFSSKLHWEHSFLFLNITDIIIWFFFGWLILYAKFSRYCTYQINPAGSRDCDSRRPTGKSSGRCRHVWHIVLVQRRHTCVGGQDRCHYANSPDIEMERPLPLVSKCK